MTKQQKILWGLFAVGILAMTPMGAIGFTWLIVEQAITWSIYVFLMGQWWIMRRGDKGTVKRGIHGQAKVLSAQRTNTQLESGQADFLAPFIWRYELEVTLPGKAPYHAQLMSVEQFQAGDVIAVSANRHRLKHVAYAGDAAADAHPTVAQAAEPVMLQGIRGSSGTRVLPNGGKLTWTVNTTAASPEVDVADELGKLADLRDRGVLTGTEFDQRKAKLLAE